MIGYWPSSLLRVLICISQIQLRRALPPSPPPTPRATAEHLPTLSVPTLANFAWPGSGAFAHPGTNPELLIILIFRPLHR